MHQPEPPASTDPDLPASASGEASHPSPDAPFLLLTSSGTTGAPKAFLKTRRQYSANIDVSREHLGATTGVDTFAPGPLSFSLTLYALFESLGTGGTVHLADRLDELWLTPRLREEAITRIVTVPSALHALAEAAERDPARLSGLDTVISCGAALPPSTRRRFAALAPQARVISCFGAAELGFIGDSRGTDGTIRLYPLVQARVRDDGGVDLPDGELGTLWVRSPSCSDAYLGGSGTPLADAEGWATVHDQGRLHGRDFSFSGRRGDVVTTGGYTVALDTVERAFDGMPGLGAVCAIAQPHASLGAVITLVVEGEAPDWLRLRTWARSRLPSASVPRRWRAVPELPRTSGGKVRRAAVAELLSERRSR